MFFTIIGNIMVDVCLNMEYGEPNVLSDIVVKDSYITYITASIIPILILSFS